MNQIIDDIEIIQLNAEADVPYSLLLLADPSKFLIDQYLKNSQLFVGYLNKEMIACYVLCPIHEVPPQWYALDCHVSHKSLTTSSRKENIGLKPETQRN